MEWMRVCDYLTDYIQIISTFPLEEMLVSLMININDDREIRITTLVTRDSNIKLLLTEAVFDKRSNLGSKTATRQKFVATGKGALMCEKLMIYADYDIIQQLHLALSELIFDSVATVIY
jgi:hypothetical protein